MPCSQCQGIESQFNQKYAERDLRQYHKKGPKRTTRMLIDALRVEGVEGLSLLDIGGGVGVVQHEMLKAGVARATGVDASSAFLSTVAEEATEQGTADRMDQHHGDFVEVAASIDPAGIVTLDRVICCYPDMEALVGLSAARAQRLYGVVYPRQTWWTRLLFVLINFVERVRRSSFRAFIHSPKAVEALVQAQGLVQRSYAKTVLWQVVVYGRP